MRKTKIICTLGPAVGEAHLLRQLILEGMDVARLNFSHGSHEEHKIRLDMFKAECSALGRPIPLLLDTKGPEIRIGNIRGDGVDLIEGGTFVLCSDDICGDEKGATVSYPELCKDVGVGQSILIDDGLIELTVTDIQPGCITCRVVNGGHISSRKSVNVPGAPIHLPSLTEKDIDDMRFAVEQGFDFIAMSFVRSADDVIAARKQLKRMGGEGISIIAKIENREGVDNADEIIRVSDGLMVARGDLGVELPVDEIPVVQKQLIKKCYQSGKPVITATQMLDSMIRNPRPTRAEANDIANAIFDGTSCIMLSGETASGKYPVESLKMMVRITETTEASVHYWKRFTTASYDMQFTVSNAISHATCTTAMNLGAAAIVTVTKTGATARMISRFRPACPIIAGTPSRQTQRQLMHSWGDTPYLSGMVRDSDELFETALATALESGLVQTGDVAVITAGVPVGISGTTNILKVEMAGHVLANGKGLGTGLVTGELCVAKSEAEARERFVKEDILVVPFTSNDMLPLLRQASALVVEDGDPASHAATAGQALDIPVVYGVEHATDRLKSGTVVTIDAARGLISKAD